MIAPSDGSALVVPRVLRLSIPGRAVSGNAAFRYTRRGQRYTSAEAVEYKERVRNIAFAHALRLRWKPVKACEVQITLYNTRLDLDNAAKVTLDGLRGVAIEDDRYITRLVIEKIKDESGPRIEIEVTG